MKMVNPMDPTSCMGGMDRQARQGQGPEDAEKSIQDAVKEEVDNRMQKAAKELQEKYARGEGGVENSVDRPTGGAYTAAAAQEAERRRDIKQRENAARMAKQQAQAQRDAEVKAAFANMRVDEKGNPITNAEQEEDNDDDSDAEFLDELETSEDPELLKLRNMRMMQMKAEHNERIERLRQGHGELREIVQDEFLPEITKTTRCVVHFYHSDFERCKIMDQHLSALATQHLETKFLKIDAEKAPFFSTKLNVQVLPTVIAFFEGICKPEHRQIGFNGLCAADAVGQEADRFPTSALAAKLGEFGVIDYVKPPDEAELRRLGLLPAASAISHSVHSQVRGDAEADY